MTDHVRVAVDQGIMTLTLNRPEKKNALSQAMYAVLATRWHAPKPTPPFA